MDLVQVCKKKHSLDSKQTGKDSGGAVKRQNGLTCFRTGLTLQKTRVIKKDMEESTCCVLTKLCNLLWVITNVLFSRVAQRKQVHKCAEFIHITDIKGIITSPYRPRGKESTKV